MTLRELLPALLLCALTASAADVNAALTPQENWNVVLTPLVSGLQDHTGLDYHQPSKKLILSANSPSGEPHSFELLGGDGDHSAFSNVAGLRRGARGRGARRRAGHEPRRLRTGDTLRE